MVHRLLILMAVLLSTTLLKAQDILNIQAGIGPGFAVGDFGSDDMNSPQSGYAGTVGGLVNLHVGLKPTKNFGLCFYGAMAMFPAKKGNIQSTVNSGFGLNLKATSTYYHFAMATGGFFFSGRVGNFFVLDARITAGYLWAETPSIEMKDNGIIYYKHYRTPGGGLGANGAFGFRYIVKKVFYIGASGEFNFGYPKFENAIIEERVNGVSTTFQSTYYQWIGTINITGNLGLSF